MAAKRRKAVRSTRERTAGSPEDTPHREHVPETIPLAGMRKVIASRLTASLHEMAQLTLHREIDAHALLRHRSVSESRPSINDYVLRAVAQVLPFHYALNATLEEDTIYRWRAVQLGMAVAVDEGLVAPVLRDADALTFDSLRAAAARLVRLARAGQLTMTELLGGTFTVTNLGAFGVDAFTPIINPPQVAILGVGRLVSDRMMLSLTIDHRAIDGVTGGLFLQDLDRAFQKPNELVGGPAQVSE